LTAVRYAQLEPSKLRATQAASEWQTLSQSSKVLALVLYTALSKLPVKATPQVIVYVWPLVPWQEVCWYGAKHSIVEQEAKVEFGDIGLPVLTGLIV